MSEVDPLHPTREQLESFFHGTLPEEQRQAIEDHVAECDQCCDVLRQTPPDALAERMHAAHSTMLDPTPGARPAVEAPAPQVPPQLRDHPRYRIIRRLGAGGMGVVYQAEHRLMERPVALKVIHGKLVSNEIAIERFRQEVKAAARLSHRNIVTAYDAEQAEDIHFLVMEYIDGVSLAEIVERRGRLSLLHACNFVLQAAQGLQHAHEQGMVHRDIKPQNMMRTSRGIIKILDFGLARLAENETGDGRLTEDFATLGTPDYIAPEQAHDSKSADIRSDIYSLGCTLYFLLAGQVPFPKGTSLDKVISHSERQPTPLIQLRPDVPPEVANIVERMMAKDPAERFQTPAEVVEALRPFGRPDAERSKDEGKTLTGQTMATPLDLTIQPSAKPAISTRTKNRAPNGAKKYWMPLLAGGGIVVLLGLILILSQGVPPEPQPDPVTPAVVTRPVPPISGGDDQAWINLLPQINLDSEVVAGSWERTADGLRVEAMEGARLMLPYQPPREYELEVSFTRLSGTQSIALLFVDGSGSAAYDIDGWGENLVGIQNIDGRNMNQDRTGVSRFSLANGERYTALLRVRRDRVDAYLNGDLMTTYHGDGANLSMLELWRLPRPALGIGAYDCETVFHQVRIRNLSN
ncbi:protein kinase [Blastopirellula sp. JC732]|uniref:non-specific serine/threonine protein kinase n=1 Tax=Blastopirellula sediminis TaxID=2894196 RepID=A0A9X1MPT6_9BACT|nr:serine/threonine-protein kinase [Blastopirellula sediminis]MCC9606475.1 protein kinase [Blastopirellula sediminis]MCC9630227.1 protein kinase [Blastopirellula sediminis]